VTAVRVKTDERVLHLWIGGRVVQPHEFSDRYAGARRVGQRAPTRCDGRALVTRNAKEPSGILGAADVGEGGQHGLTRMIARELGIHLTQQVSVATGRVLRTKSSNGGIKNLVGDIGALHDAAEEVAGAGVARSREHIERFLREPRAITKQVGASEVDEGWNSRAMIQSREHA